MAFLGMRGTGDWVANQRPENWRQKVLQLYPNGKAPLTAIMSMTGKERTTDPVYHWWEKAFPTQSATITSVWRDAALTIPYNGAVLPGAAGDIIYLRMTQTNVEIFVNGMVVFLRNPNDLTMDVRAKVVQANAAGANSYLAVMLYEADNNSTLTTPTYLDSATVAWIIGSAYAEGSNGAPSIMYDPQDLYNYTQIFKNALEHTRTAMQTQLRTPDQVKEARREALEFHGIEIEKAFIFGIRTQRLGANGKPERTTGGLRDFITTNRRDFSTDPNEAGNTWAAAGEAWLDTQLEIMFRYGNTEKLGLCGSGALMAINNLIKARGQVELTQVKGSYGINVTTWVTPFGSIHLKTHPLFTLQATTRNSILFVEPSNLTTAIVKDTVYQPDIQENDLDGEKSQYLAEIGLECHLEMTHGWFDNVGNDSILP